MSKTDTHSRTDIYTRVTSRIVEDLANGVRPWLKPWTVGNPSGRISLPLRHNGLPYRGMNVLLLWGEAMDKGYASAKWMTYKQAAELGGQVRKGEHGSLVVYADRFTKTEQNDRGEDIERSIPFMKGYTVFNVEQVDGLPDHYYCRPERKGEPLRLIESALQNASNPHEHWLHGVNADGENSQKRAQ